MSHWRCVVFLMFVLLVPVAAGAAPAGKVIIAQGVDPTTLDMMNQQEQPGPTSAPRCTTCWSSATRA